MGNVVVVFALFLCVLALPGAVVEAFWEKSHMMVARIAYEGLSGAQQQMLDRQLEPFGYFLSDADVRFDAAALMPDTLKGQAFNALNEMHFMNYPLIDESTLPANFTPPVDYGQLVYSLRSFLGTLVKKEGSTHFTRGFSLFYMLHQLGDMHQPLHVCERFDVKYRYGNRGGNLFKVSFRESASITNLHAFWDSGCGQFEDNDWRRDTLVTETGKAYIQEHAQAIMGEFPCDTAFEEEQLDYGESDGFKSWAQESFGICVADVYRLDEIAFGEELPAVYVNRSQTIVRKQIAKGGCRLRNVLMHVLEETAESGVYETPFYDLDSGRADGGARMSSMWLFMLLILGPITAACVFACVRKYRNRGRNDPGYVMELTELAPSMAHSEYPNAPSLLGGDDEPDALH
jgi:hypothetical protein